VKSLIFFGGQNSVFFFFFFLFNPFDLQQFSFHFLSFYFSFILLCLMFSTLIMEFIFMVMNANLLSRAMGEAYHFYYVFLRLFWMFFIY
jgi:hypothetical protein